MAFGPGESRFVEEKRHFEKPIPISEIVYLDRERCILCDRCTRFAKEVAGDPLIHFLDRGNSTAGQHVPRPPVRVVLPRQHRADLPGRRADRRALPLQGPAVGPRAGRVHLHLVLGRLPGRDRRVARPRAALPGRRHRPGQLGLAVRQGPLRLREHRQRGPPRRPARPPGRRRAGRGPLVRRPRHGRRRDQGRPRPIGSRRRRGPRRRPAHQRGRLRLGQAGQGRDRHRQRRRPARRRAAGRARARPAPRHHRRRVRQGRHGRRPRPRPQGGAAGPVPAAAPRRHRRTASRSSSWRPHDTGLTPLAATSLRYTPGGQAALVAALLDGAAPVPAGVDADALAVGTRPARPRRAGHGRARAGVGGRVRRRHRRRGRPPARRHRRRPVPAGAAPRQRPRRPRHGPGPRSAARPGHARRRPGLVRRRVAHGARRAGHRRRRRSSSAAADGRIDTLVLLGADPLADFPDRDLATRGLAGARTVIASDLFLTESAAQADVVLAGRRLRRGRGHHDEHRGPGQPRSTARSPRPAPPAPTG